MSIDVDGFEANVASILDGCAMDETEKESLSGVLLEAANSGDPPLDNLGRYAFAIDAIRWLLYVGKITTAQCGDLMALVGEMLGTAGTLLTLTDEAFEEEEKNA